MPTIGGSSPARSARRRSDRVNRVIVFGVLAAFLTAVYAAIVIGLGAALEVEPPNTALAVLAMTLVAVGFGRARAVAQRLAARVVHGERATPYEVLSGVSRPSTGSTEPGEVLPRMAELTAAGIGAARADIWLRVGNDMLLAARWPAGAAVQPSRVALPDEGLPAFPGAQHAVGIRDGVELLGAIAVTKRGSEAPTPDEARLLEDVASQAGLVVRNLGLAAQLTARLDELAAVTTELRASRRRIVETQDQERRRIERDIHDGAQQHLVALAVKVRMARTLAERDPARTTAMIGEVRTLADGALANLRSLTLGIYPPSLAERGLAAALEDHVQRAGGTVTITSSGTGRADPAAETAAYFTCLEAIQNAAKHAPGSVIRVHLEVKGSHLRFTVADEGAGFDPAQVARGSGLKNMADRVGAVGGTVTLRSAPGTGTIVEGRIPLAAAGSSA